MSAQITSNFLASPLCSDLPPRLYFPEDTLAFTHTSKHKAKHYAFEADDEPDQLQDYERLEHLGDALLGLIVTELIGELYPRLTVGSATVLKSRLVNNKDSLAHLSLFYRLPNLLQGSTTQIDSLRRTSSIQADIFESYLATCMKHHGLDPVKTWIRQVFTPLAKLHYTNMKSVFEAGGVIPEIVAMESEAAYVADGVHTDPLPTPPLASGSQSDYVPRFSQPYQPGFQPPPPAPAPAPAPTPPQPAPRPTLDAYAQENPTEISYVPFLEIWRAKGRDRSATFTYGPPMGPAHQPVFTCDCEVKGWPTADHRQVYFGSGSTKKAAKNRAAQEGVEKMGLRVGCSCRRVRGIVLTRCVDCQPF